MVLLMYANLQAEVDFFCVLQLEDAAKQKNLSETESYYQKTTPILQEVMDRMAKIGKF